jgi:hypothetical protein
MFKIIIFSLIVLGAASSGIMHLSQSLYRSSMIMQDRLLVQSVINRLSRSVVFESGEYYVPLGINKNNYHQLPLYFSGNRTTSTGIPFVYCPYGVGVPTTSVLNIPVKEDVTYGVTISESLSTDGHPYVVSSDALNIHNILAAIIVPRNGSRIPNCNDIGIDENSNYVLSNDSEDMGTVYVISSDEMSNLGDNSITTVLNSDSDPQALQEALTVASQKPDSNILIIMQSGESFSLDTSVLLSSSSIFKPRTIHIKSSLSGAPATLSSQVPVSLRVENINFVFEDVLVSGSTFLDVNDSDVHIVNSNAVSLQMKRGELTLEGAGFGATSTNIPLSLSGVDVKQISSAVTVSGKTSFLIGMTDSSWNTNGNDINFNYSGSSVLIQLLSSKWVQRNSEITTRGNGVGSTVWFVDSGSELVMDNSVWSNSDSFNYGIYSEGKIILRDSLLNSSNKTNVAIFTDDSSFLELDNSVIGSLSQRPQIGIQDAKSRGITGASTIYASVCFNDGHFSDNYNITVQDDTVLFATPDGFVFPIQYPEIVSVDISGNFIPALIDCL